MKKIVSIIFMVAVMMLLSPLRTVGGNIRYTATYGGNVTIGTRTLGNATYSTVSYEGLYNMGDPGTPSLPVDYIKFSVPWNATNFSVSASAVEGETLSLDYPVCPIQSTAGSITQPDNGIYSGGNYPSQSVWYDNNGEMAGENRVVTVAVMPLIWVQANGINSLRQMTSVSLTLNYELSATPISQPLVRRGASLREEGYERVRGYVVNPDDVTSNAASYSNGQQFNSFSLPASADTLINPATYMIVTTEPMLKPLRRLAALQRQKGMKVKMVTMNEVINDTLSNNGAYEPNPGTGKSWTFGYAEDHVRLRQYLRMHYIYYGTEYVLLAGTSVPSRETDGTYTDYYYSELQSDYNGVSNINVYGNLAVGRLLGKQPQQFDNYTNKLLRYQLNPGNGNYSYLDRALFIESGDCGTFGPYSNGLFTDCTYLNVNGNEYTGSDVTNMIKNNHYGFLSAFNDGFPSAMRVYYDFDDSSNHHYVWAIDTVRVAAGVTDNETGNGLNRLDNKLYPMVCLSGYGVTMPYDTIVGYSVNVNCGESFTMGKDYGGPAYFGYTGSVNLYQASLVANKMFDYMQNKPILGNLEVSAKGYFLNEDYKSMKENLNLLGDPAIDMWTDVPVQYTNITVSRTDNGITVSGISSSNTTVAYHSNDGNTGSVTSTSSGTVTLNNVSPNSTIMLYKHNAIPYIAPLVLQNTLLENSQYVFATDVTAGRSVDSGRTNGDVTVTEGAEYEIEASGKVILAGGFKVERGAYFNVHKASYK